MASQDKEIAFTLGNFLIGAAGALFGMVGGFVAPNNYTFADSLRRGRCATRKPSSLAPE
jgi:ABC-type branched-subunit amino acid transport system permease subunit